VWRQHSATEHLKLCLRGHELGQVDFFDEQVGFFECLFEAVTERIEILVQQMHGSDEITSAGRAAHFPEEVARVGAGRLTQGAADDESRAQDGSKTTRRMRSRHALSPREGFCWLG